MKFVKPKDLTTDMLPVRSIYNKRHELLLAANHPLTPQIIARLEMMGLKGILVYDEYSSMEEYRGYISEDSRYEAVNALMDLSIDKVIYCVNDIVDQLMANNDILLDMSDLQFYDSDTYEHSMNVCLLSTACGIVIGLDDPSLRKLAVGAMLHDIGKMSISKDILNKPGKLNVEERKIINTHPQRGYDMTYDNYSVSVDSRMCILCHHENWDGSGYPNNLKADGIPYLARIVHVADVYDAMCQKRAYKDEYNPVEVIEYLYANCGSMFDKNIVSGFLRSVVVFPVGTRVELSNGEKAVVIRNRASYVTRPVVCLEKDKSILDLAKDRSTFNITIKGTESINAITRDTIVT